jgi:hypothetical protein
MKKGIIVAIWCGLLLLICLMLYRPGKDEPSMEVKPGTTGAPPAANAFPASISYVSEPKSQPSAAVAEVVLVPRKVSDAPGETTSAPRPEYVWYTQPTSKGAIKNSKGEIIFQATDELPFVSMRSRANVSQIVIVSGNRNAFVIDPETKQRVALPKQPPEEGAKGFETWEWIDDNTLLAEYHVQAKGPDGKSVSCCQGHGIAETRLYAYNLKSNALVRVALPKQLEGTPFSIGRIADDGSLEVATPSNHLTDGKRIGWFDLTANK